MADARRADAAERERSCSRLGKACLDRAPAAHRFPQLCRPVAERRPRSRGADRRQRLRQDQPARGPVPAHLGPRAAPGALSGAGAHGAAELGRGGPPRHAARARRSRHRARPGRRRRPRRPRRAHRRRDPIGLGRARRACRDGLAHASHGWPLHRSGVGPPALSRPTDCRPRSRATGRCWGSSSGRCSSATGCWRRTCATARVSRASSGSWPKPAWPWLRPGPRPSPRSRRRSARAATRRTVRSSRGPSLPSSARSKRISPRGPPSTSRTTTSASLPGARTRPRRRAHAAGAAPLRPHGGARTQGDARQGVLDRRAEGAADRSCAGPLRPRRPAPRRPRAHPAPRRDRRPSRPRCGGPRCSRKSLRWAAKPGCPAPIRRPSRRSGIGPNSTASRRAASRPADKAGAAAHNIRKIQ